MSENALEVSSRPHPSLSKQTVSCCPKNASSPLSARQNSEAQPETFKSNPSASVCPAEHQFPRSKTFRASWSHGSLLFLRPCFPAIYVPPIVITGHGQCSGPHHTALPRRENCPARRWKQGQMSPSIPTPPNVLPRFQAQTPNELRTSRDESGIDPRLSRVGDYFQLAIYIQASSSKLHVFLLGSLPWTIMLPRPAAPGFTFAGSWRR